MPALTGALMTVPVTIAASVCLSLLTLPGTAHANDPMGRASRGLSVCPEVHPEGLQKYLEPIWEAGSTGYQWDTEQRKKYVNKDFPPGWDACDKDYVWVDWGDPLLADVENAVTPEVLAELAYAEIRVPSTKVTAEPVSSGSSRAPRMR